VTARPASPPNKAWISGTRIKNHPVNTRTAGFFLATEGHPVYEIAMITRLVTSTALAVLCLFATPACQTPELRERNQAIAMEPDGDHFIGRRYFVEQTRFWGYVRKPRQSWDTARLVIMNERHKKTPDRLPEVPTDGGLAVGYDHNREYRLEGYFSGEAGYDPNTNMFLPEFVLTGYQLINPSPGWLFRPDERYNPKAVTIKPPGGIPQM